MKDIISQVEIYITPIVEALGYEIIEVEYLKKYDDMNLTVYIDKEGGIMLEDCEKVHKAIDGPLDDLDPTKGARYILNVSSPGIDRPLKNTKDYKRNKGKDVEVSFYTPIDGNKKHCGILTEWTNDSVTIDGKDGLKTFDKKDISIIRPII